MSDLTEIPPFYNTSKLRRFNAVHRSDSKHNVPPVLLIFVPIIDTADWQVHCLFLLNVATEYFMACILKARCCRRCDRVFPLSDRSFLWGKILPAEMPVLLEYRVCRFWIKVAFPSSFISVRDDRTLKATGLLWTIPSINIFSSQASGWYTDLYMYIIRNSSC